MKARKVLFNGECEEIDFVKKDYDDRFVIEIDRKFEFENVKYIDVMYDEYHAKAGDEGYFVLPQSRSDEDGMLVYFNEKENMIFESGRSLSAFMYGVKKETESFLAVITLNCLTYTYVVEIKENQYYIYPRFIVNGDKPYDNFEITFFKMTKGNDSYSDMAVKYRSYMIEKGFLTPIRERMNENLKYACESIYVRIRQGWKPVPSVVEEQTIENEPHIHVACTFAQVEDIMQAYKNKKIDKAEFCLVGWNVKGHDGRWPSALPVEESLGGEEGLKKLIKKAKELGYTISCHTNSTDAYTISEYYCDDDIKVGKNQQILKHENMWSGGRARWVCPSQYLKIARKILPDISKFGFNGIHYIDVIGIMGIGRCYSEKHPLTEKDIALCNKRLADYVKKLFGGYSSEGAYAHHAGCLDYALYISFCTTDDNEYFEKHKIADKRIPLWSLIYHGIVLSNPYVSTINVPIKGKRSILELMERGGRPALYFNSEFVNSDNEIGMEDWLGSVDFYNNTKEQIEYSAEKSAEFYQEYKKYAYLQSEMIKNHEETKKNVFVTTYENGDKIKCDYNNLTYELIKEQ